MAVLEISASVETDRVDAELTTIQVEAQLAPLSIQAVLDKPKIDLDDPTAV